jgi:5-formyltetrahydrofolate cyclo-ligase
MPIAPEPDDKASIRSAALTARQALSAEQRTAAARAIAARAFPVAITAGAVVAGYMPIKGELDPRPLMQALAAHGVELAMPSIAANEQPLIFRAWREADAMRKGALGISEPLPEAAPVVPDLVLVPLSAFDRRGHRIGYGAGHYDRSLGHLRIEKPVVAIGLAYAMQEVAMVPAQAHDVPLDFVLTEREIISCRSS